MSVEVVNCPQCQLMFERTNEGGIVECPRCEQTFLPAPPEEDELTLESDDPNELTEIAEGDLEVEEEIEEEILVLEVDESDLKN